MDGSPGGRLEPIFFFFLVTTARVAAQNVKYSGTLPSRDDTSASYAEGGTGTSSSYYKSLTDFVSVDEASSETPLGHFVS
jgi:hypothetical protein